LVQYISLALCNIIAPENDHYVTTDQSFATRHILNGSWTVATPVKSLDNLTTT